MSAHLVDGLGTTDALAEIFSDASVLQAMLDVESALARVQARLGLIPDKAAGAIAGAARADRFDAEAIARDGRASATPIVPLVAALKQLRAIQRRAPRGDARIHRIALRQAGIHRPPCVRLSEFRRAMTIFGGSSEIQHGIIAKTLWGY